MTGNALSLVLAASLMLCSNKSKPRHEDVRWYGNEAPTDQTADGERFNPFGLTYASSCDPFNTTAIVHWHGKTVTVRCNDRGPNRIELTLGAFQRLANPNKGVLRGAEIEYPHATD